MAFIRSSIPFTILKKIFTFVGLTKRCIPIYKKKYITKKTPKQSYKVKQSHIKINKFTVLCALLLIFTTFLSNKFETH